jgi:thiamine kinase-like enzyme
VAPLGRGLVNESHRVRRDGRMYSLRMPSERSAPIGVDREWECRVLAVASAAGIAPAIERCEPRLGVLVARWVDGPALGAEEARRPETGARLTALARRVHALPLPDHPRVLSPGDWIQRYGDALADLDAGCAPRTARLDPAGLQPEAERRLRALAALPRAADVLCHSDLHPANLVAGNAGLILIDWEYAHVSEALWDVAGWACNIDLQPESRDGLLASYLGRPPAPAELRRLDHLAWLYDYVCLLWSEVYCGSTAPSDPVIPERARVLALRLARQAGGDLRELPAH